MKTQVFPNEIDPTRPVIMEAPGVIFFSDGSGPYGPLDDPQEMYYIGGEVWSQTTTTESLSYSVTCFQNPEPWPPAWYCTLTDNIGGGHLYWLIVPNTGPTGYYAKASPLGYPFNVTVIQP